jgi:mannose-1-phosphate guanylyltransferase
MHNQGHDWALILAAGEGSRLRSLTTTNGVAVPKQFCSLNGGVSLLQEALHRAETVVPQQRVCTIVAAQHRRWWESPLYHLPAANVVVQPQNRGTAIGILLPLLHLERRDPDARLVLLPSDHFVRDEGTLARSLRAALRQLPLRGNEVVLLGISPEEADPELGYIVPGRTDRDGAFGVQRFVEKPAAPMARALVEQGAVWNSFIIAARLSALMALYERRFPEIVQRLRRAVECDVVCRTQAAVAAAYERLPEVDFSRHVLEGQEATLRVLPVPNCGWSDLGTPRRVAAALASTDRRELPARLHRTATAILDLAVQHARLQLAS